MRISTKTAFFSLFTFCFCLIGYSQSSGNQLMTQLLEEENVSVKDNTEHQKLEKAMTILDKRKESGKLSEKDFQLKLNDLMAYQKELRAEFVAEKLDQSEKNRADYLERKERGEVKDIFDISKDRLKVKLDKGQITQSQYDDKLKSLNERQMARKASKAK